MTAHHTSCLVGRLGHATASQLVPRCVEAGDIVGEKVQLCTAGLDHTAVLTEVLGR